MPRGEFGNKVKFIIVGGGIVGLATGLELKRLSPGSKIAILEKENRVGNHQSTHNSGVLHAGLYYKPGSLKAKLAVSGIRKMKKFCEENEVPHEICGKIVLAADETELPRLKKLFVRGTENGLVGLKWLSSEQIREREPYAGGAAGILVPEEGIVDYRAVCDAMSRNLVRQGVDLHTSVEVDRVVREGAEWIVSGNFEQERAEFVINCAGLYSDRVAKMAGERRDTRIVPFRGEYYKLKASASHLVRHLIYPVPDPTFPFLGVHFTRMINGGIEAGPNAVLALSREGYNKWDVNVLDAFDSLGFRGFWRFMVKHRSVALDEIRRSFSRRLFCASLKRLVPALVENDLEAGISGVRAQAMKPDGTLSQDFEFQMSQNILHVINAPSPGATASLAIGEYIASRALNIMNLA